MNTHEVQEKIKQLEGVVASLQTLLDFETNIFKRTRLKEELELRTADLTYWKRREATADEVTVN